MTYIFGINTPSATILSITPQMGTMCAPRKKLIIELDGSQHLNQQEYDEERTKYLEARGYRVLRFWNKDLLNDMDAVLKTIWDVLKEGDKK
jgi:very-short-patch-repair endonuclease